MQRLRSKIIGIGWCLGWVIYSLGKTQVNCYDFCLSFVPNTKSFDVKEKTPIVMLELLMMTIYDRDGACHFKGPVVYKAPEII